MYDRTNSSETLDEARLHLFAQKEKQIEAIPPTEAALLQHTKRAIYQGALIWGNASEPKPDFPSPAYFRWIKNDGQLWEPLWTMFPEATDSCQELVHCKCKMDWRRICKCFKSALPCTALCILVQSSNRSARKMSIFQEIQNSKKSKKSDIKTGYYSSFKITKIYFQEKSLCNFFAQNIESTLPKYAPSILPVNYPVY